MSFCLSRDELIELSGYKRRDRVAVWLAGRGYKFEIAADGWPRVLRAAVEQRLMPKPTDGEQIQPRTEPNWAALDEIDAKRRSNGATAPGKS